MPRSKLEPHVTDKQRVLTRVQRVAVELVVLEPALRKHSEPDLADSVKRARREFETLERTGGFKF